MLEADRSPIRLPLITLIFALVGLLLGLLLAGGTAALYVARTGGKPIESGPPIGIIMYEVWVPKEPNSWKAGYWISRWFELVLKLSANEHLGSPSRVDQWGNVANCVPGD